MGKRKVPERDALDMSELATLPFTILDSIKEAQTLLHSNLQKLKVWGESGRKLERRGIQ